MIDRQEGRHRVTMDGWMDCYADGRLVGGFVDGRTARQTDSKKLGS